MSIRIVRLGSPRAKNEGLRIGTVRRPPRGVPKHEFATRDFYDVWFPNLAPTEPLLKATFPVKDERAWKTFRRKFLAELKSPRRDGIWNSWRRCHTPRTSRSGATASTSPIATGRFCASS